MVVTRQSLRPPSTSDGGVAPLEPGAHITDADVKRLYAERRYDEMNTLRQAGRLEHLLNGPPPKPAPEPEPTPPPAPAPEDWRPGYGLAFCLVPGLMEALNPREDESHGSTEEVPRGASGASDPDGGRRAA